MAQAPATSKAKRALRLTLASVIGHARLCELDGTLQPSERAAIELRAHAPKSPPHAVVFLIPLVGPHHVRDWSGVCDRLGDTLKSLQAQKDESWRALICGQTRPTSLPADSRISFLPFDELVAGNDKWRKLAHLAEALPEHAPRAGYAMTFDADDLAHPDLVAEMMRRRQPGGYLARTGYVLDSSAGLWALAGPREITRPLRKPFWKLCGSCAALRYDLDSGGDEIALLREMSQHEHRMFPYLAMLSGRRLTALSRPLMTYLLNHGDNFGARRGRVSFKTRFVRRYRIDDPDTINALERAFPRPSARADYP